MPSFADPIHLVTACDDAYAMPLAAMLRSVTSNLADSRRVNAFILEGGLSGENRQRLEGSIDRDRMELTWVSVDSSRFDPLRGTVDSSIVVSIATYYRLLIQEVLPADLEKVVYLDCDLILNRDLGELWDQDVDGHYLLAVPELPPQVRFVSSSEGLRLYEDLGLPATLEYFNAGVLVINLEMWREEYLAQRIGTYLNICRADVLWHDQDGLNAVIAGRWGELDPRWNVTMHAYRLDLEDPAIRRLIEDPFIIHFNGEFKPWHREFEFGYRDLFFSHLDRTAWAGWRPSDAPARATKAPGDGLTPKKAAAGIVGAARRVLYRDVYPHYEAAASQVRMMRSRRAVYRELPRPEHSPIPDNPHELRLFMVARNEELRLPYLLDYYFDRGVDRAFVVDNRSTDTTRELLLARNNVHVFEPRGSYRAARCGHDWLLNLIHHHGMNQWCVVVDADEVFSYPYADMLSLKELCAYLDRRGFDSVFSHLLDMYSDRPVSEVGYSPGDDPLAACEYFDPAYKRVPVVYSDRLTDRVSVVDVHVGGLRERAFGLYNYCSKVPLVKPHRDLTLIQGMHSAHGARFADIQGVVFHFKYLQDLGPRAIEEVALQSRDTQADEYGIYARKIEAGEDLGLWSEESVKFRDLTQLVDLGIMKTTADFTRFATATVPFDEPSQKPQAPELVTSEWRREVRKAAEAEIKRFLGRNKDFALVPDQPPEFSRQLQFGTNFVHWGTHRGEPVIFKFYHGDLGVARWRNERACLQLFESTGRVPKIHDAVDERLIVMSCVPGRFLRQEVASGNLDVEALVRIGHELGEAVGKLVNTPLPDIDTGYSVIRDYEIIPWNTDLREAVNFYLRLCRRDRACSKADADPFYEESLSLVERMADRIAGQRQVIYNEDLHCFVDQGRFQGFIDLEMSRLGTDLMQLERVFRQCSSHGVNWSCVLSAYQTETGRRLGEDDYAFMLAMGQFSYFIRITRWGSPDAERDYAAEFLPRMKKQALRYADYVELAEHFPSLDGGRAKE